MPHRSIAFAVALLASVATVFARQAQKPPLADAPERFEVRFDPTIWIPAIRGDIGVGTSGTFDVETINLDEIEPTPKGRFQLRSGDLTVAFSAFSTSYSETETAGANFAVGGTPVAAGSSVDYELDVASFELTVGHRVWNAPVGVNDPDPEAARGSNVDVWLDAYAGARYYDIDAQFNTPVSTSGDVEDIHAIVGLALKMDLPEGFGLELSFDAGGGAEGFSWDVTVAFDYEITDNAALLIGFRNLSTNLEGDGGPGDAEFDATLAGLFASLSIRF